MKWWWIETARERQHRRVANLVTIIIAVAIVAWVLTYGSKIWLIGDEPLPPQTQQDEPAAR